MNKLQNWFGSLWSHFFILCGSLWVLFPTSPFNMPLTDRDSGLFLYVGWRILNGDLPYRDVWDHKPPVIFYINALGLFLTNNSRWGVWLLELGSLCLAGSIGFLIMRKAFGVYPAILSSVLWLSTLVFVIEGGNLATEYTLPLQFGALLLVYAVGKTGFASWRWLLIGFLGAIAFFTKQTAIGLWISIFIYMTIVRLKSRQFTPLAKELGLMFIGSFMVCLGWIIFFWLQGGLAQFWDAAFRYNFFYSAYTIDVMTRIKHNVLGVAPLAKTGLMQASLIGYLIGMLLLYFRKRISDSWWPVLCIGLIDLPMEFLLIGTSGLAFAHYYMAILPVFSIFTGLVFWMIVSAVSAWGVSDTAKAFFTLGAAVIFLWASLTEYYRQILFCREQGYQTPIRYIQANTHSDDSVLITGAGSYINYFAQRKSPTRFVYQYPLYNRRYVDEEMIVEFLGDIIEACPRLIIDTGDARTPLYKFPIQSDAINASIKRIQSRYELDDPIGSWVVYKRLENACSP